jgi:D-serine deaminase-like pyridoxal phosphate-dependent protein
MAQRPPASPGDPIDAVDTPALVVDLDALERNLDTLARDVAAKGLRLRPHAKSHKTPDIAKLQMARGAVGVCCQKVDEAAAFVEAGIADVLVTNEVVAAPKLARLAQLARGARMGVLVDDARAVEPLARAAQHAGVTIDAYVEVDVGAGRCGVLPGEPAAALALKIVGEKGLRFAGLHCYHGAAQHLRSPEERRAAIASAAEKSMASKRAVRARRVEGSDRHRRRHRHVGARARVGRVERAAGRARTSSWTPTTRATRRAKARSGSSTACSCSRRS